MKDEINEILEFKEDADYKRISIDEMIILQDYITNLQEENDYYFKKNNELSALNTSLRSDRDNYKSRNEKAVKFANEYIKEDYYDKLDEYITHFTWNKEKEDLLSILTGSDE